MVLIIMMVLIMINGIDNDIDNNDGIDIDNDKWY